MSLSDPISIGINQDTIRAIETYYAARWYYVGDSFETWTLENGRQINRIKEKYRKPLRKNIADVQGNMQIEIPVFSFKMYAPV